MHTGMKTVHKGNSTENTVQSETMTTIHMVQEKSFMSYGAVSSVFSLLPILHNKLECTVLLFAHNMWTVKLLMG